MFAKKKCFIGRLKGENATRSKWYGMEYKILVIVTSSLLTNKKICSVLARFSKEKGGKFAYSNF